MNDEPEKPEPDLLDSLLSAAHTRDIPRGKAGELLRKTVDLVATMYRMSSIRQEAIKAIEAGFHVRWIGEDGKPRAVPIKRFEDGRWLHQSGLTMKQVNEQRKHWNEVELPKLRSALDQTEKNSQVFMVQVLNVLMVAHHQITGGSLNIDVLKTRMSGTVVQPVAEQEKNDAEEI